MNRESLERATGEFFSQLWSPYDERLFEESVELFARRLDAVGFDRDWFRSKTVLDAGCGGGRNTIAMRRLGASRACGIDLGKGGIDDARKRTAAVDHVEFQVGSILDIPYPDATFDLVWCAGVLMITEDEHRALDELKRVLKPGGKLYLLIYATGGQRWPLIQLLRPIAERIGKPAFEEAIAACNMPPNKRRTFLDDLFCPKLDFYHWERLLRMLNERGFQSIERWGPEARLDHEHSLQDYREDLAWLAKLFAAGAKDNTRGFGRLFDCGHRAISATLDGMRLFEEDVAVGNLHDTDASSIVIGQGHHRVMAVKGS